MRDSAGSCQSRRRWGKSRLWQYASAWFISHSSKGFTFVVTAPGRQGSFGGFYGPQQTFTAPNRPHMKVSSAPSTWAGTLSHGSHRGDQAHSQAQWARQNYHGLVIEFLILDAIGQASFTPCRVVDSIRVVGPGTRTRKSPPAGRRGGREPESRSKAPSRA
jgi:hypothetical protein